MKIKRFHLCALVAISFSLAGGAGDILALERVAHSTAVDGSIHIQIQDADLPASAYRLDVHDLRTGERISTASDLVASPVQHTIDARMVGLPSGVYQLRLYASGKEIDLIHEQLR